MLLTDAAGAGWDCGPHYMVPNRKIATVVPLEVLVMVTAIEAGGGGDGTGGGGDGAG